MLSLSFAEVSQYLETVGRLNDEVDGEVVGTAVHPIESRCYFNHLVWEVKIVVPFNRLVKAVVSSGLYGYSKFNVLRVTRIIVVGGERYFSWDHNYS